MEILMGDDVRFARPQCSTSCCVCHMPPFALILVLFPLLLHPFKIFFFPSSRYPLSRVFLLLFTCPPAG